MMKKYILLLLLLLNYNVYAASFDCSKASTEVERTICSSDALSSLDSSLGVLYSEKKDNNLIKDQRKWLKEVRNKATSVESLTGIYIDRIKFLSQYSARDNNDGQVQSKEMDLQKNKQQAPQGSFLDYEKEYVVINGIEYSTRIRSYRTAYVSRCTDLRLLDGMAIMEDGAIKSGQISDFRRLRDNIYTGLWNYIADDTQRRIATQDMQILCRLLIDLETSGLL